MPKVVRFSISSFINLYLYFRYRRLGLYCMPSKMAASTRPIKRAKLQSNDTLHSGSAANREGLFAPFRSLGYVSTGVPFVVQSRSSKFLETPAMTVVTSVGRSWAMWNVQSLTLLFVGPDMGAPITSLAMNFDSVFAAASNFIGRYVRGQEVGRLVLSVNRRSYLPNHVANGEPSGSPEASSSSSDSETSEDEDEGNGDTKDTTLTNLVLFGTTMVALASSGLEMYVWEVPSIVNPASVEPSTSKASSHSAFTTPYATLRFPSGFTAVKVVHPASYLDKVVVGSREGALAVWNVRNGSLVHTFSPSDISTSPAAITALAQSSAIDVLGVGMSNGQCLLFDVRMGEVLGRVRLEGEGSGAVVGVSFRNDELSQTLAVSSSSGHMAIFDLADKLKLLHLVRSAHEGPVGSVEWLPGQPLIMTSGEDNSLKQWLLDSPTAIPRLLKQRSGHHAPPHLIRYYKEDGKSILSAGKDRSLRFTSIVRDSRGFELSQGSVWRKSDNLGVKPSSLKLPIITSMSHSTARSKDWDDLLTASGDETLGRSWSVEGKRLGKFAFHVDGFVKVTAMTACGNFGLVGSSGGDVVLHNMQSGMKRKVFKIPTTGAQDVTGKQISGLATDSLNRLVIASTLRGSIYFFDFQTMKLLKTVNLPASIGSITLQRDSGLLAVVCDDLIVRILDIETQRVVRELHGARGRILDLAFSPDSRWILTTSQDSIIRTFDVPTGQLVDAFRTTSVATSLTFSPTSDFLATAHVNSLGIHLWANRAQFSEVALRPFDERNLHATALPTIQGSSEETLGTTVSELLAPANWDNVQPYTTPEQLSDELLTLSLMPRSRWQTLLNLETIKQRNKPKEAPKAPERAPFFLPTLPGVDQRFDFGIQESATTVSGTAEEGSKRKGRTLDIGAANVETEFVRRLMMEYREGDYQDFFEYLKALSPSATDLELRSLTLLPQLATFLHAIYARLKSHRDFEAVQTYLAYFLRIHGDIMVQNVEMKEAMMKIAEEQKKEADRLTNLVHYALGTLSFLRSTPMV